MSSLFLSFLTNFKRSFFERDLQFSNGTYNYSNWVVVGATCQNIWFNINTENFILYNKFIISEKESRDLLGNYKSLKWVPPNIIISIYWVCKKKKRRKKDTITLPPVCCGVICLVLSFFSGHFELVLSCSDPFGPPRLSIHLIFRGCILTNLHIVSNRIQTEMYSEQKNRVGIMFDDFLHSTERIE